MARLKACRRRTSKRKPHSSSKKPDRTLVCVGNKTYIPADKVYVAVESHDGEFCVGYLDSWSVDYVYLKEARVVCTDYWLKPTSHAIATCGRDPRLADVGHTVPFRVINGWCDMACCTKEAQSSFEGGDD